MKQATFLYTLLLLSCLLILMLPACTVSKTVREKSGALLWSENCSRCHYSPDPEDYNDAQWEVISLHMRVRTSLTEEETEKITAFLQQSN